MRKACVSKELRADLWIKMRDLFVSGQNAALFFFQEKGNATNPRESPSN